jgi:RluA family pseudouridine synthase
MDKWKVNDGEAKTKLLCFLKSKYQEKYTQKQIRFAIEHHRCHVDGKVERFASSDLTPGSIVEIEIDPHHFTYDPARLLFEDPYFIAYNKPPFINTVDGLDHLLRSALGPCFPIHRLDRDTTGVLLFAKQRKVKEDFKKLFHDRRIEKRYLCIVAGIPKQPSGQINTCMIARKRVQGKSLWQTCEDKKGKWALTLWNCEKRGKYFSLLSCTPITGRTHQIRVHLKHIGHPILGDFDYGTREVHPHFQPIRPLLHAEKLLFEHPISAKKMNLSAPLPPDFKECLKYL